MGPSPAADKRATLVLSTLRSRRFTAFVLAVVLAVFSVGHVAMARHITNAGAFYAYIAHGIGRPAGQRAAGAQQTQRLALEHAPHDVAVNLLRYLGRGATLVSGPAGQPALLAFMDRRLFAVLVFTLRDNMILKIEASVDPSAAMPR